MAAKEKGYTSSSNKIVVFKHCKHLHTGNTTRTGSFRPPLFHIISTAPIVRLLSRRSRPVLCAAAAMGSSDSQAPLLLPRGSHRKEEEEEEYAAAGKVRGCCGGDGEGGWWREATAEAGRLASLAAPMIAVALLQLMMQLISTVMVGHLGEVALAGAAIANSLTNVSGFSVLVSALFPSIIFFYPSVRETTPLGIEWDSLRALWLWPCGGWHLAQPPARCLWKCPARQSAMWFCTAGQILETY